MAKKKKKQVQKRKQAKALKQRVRKKALRKKMPRKTERYPGLPPNLPPGTIGFAKQMMTFAHPLITNVESESELQLLLPLTQALWNAFIIREPEKRGKLLREAEALYTAIPTLTMEFNEFVDYMLKRHIYYFPEKHTEEEKNRFSEAELRAAVEAEITSSLTKVDYELPDFDPDQISALITEEEAAQQQTWHAALKDKFDRIDYLSPDNPELELLNQYQAWLVDLYARSLKQQGVTEKAVEALSANVNTFLAYFLREYQAHNLWTCTADDMEEFILDFFIRKVTATPEQEDLLIRSFQGFFTFVEKMGYIEDASEFLKRIDECAEEYRELLEEYRSR